MLGPRCDAAGGKDTFSQRRCPSGCGAARPLCHKGQYYPYGKYVASSNDNIGDLTWPTIHNPENGSWSSITHPKPASTIALSRKSYRNFARSISAWRTKLPQQERITRTFSSVLPHLRDFPPSRSAFPRRISKRPMVRPRRTVIISRKQAYGQTQARRKPLCRTPFRSGANFRQTARTRLRRCFKSCGRCVPQDHYGDH